MNNTPEFPDHIARDLERIQVAEQTDKTTTLIKLLTNAIQDWKLDHYAKAYGARKISMARAAQEAGVTLWEMMEYVREHKIPAQYDTNDLEHDLAEIYQGLGKPNN